MTREEAKRRQRERHNEMLRILRTCCYPIEHAADWWLASHDAAETLRVVRAG